MINTRVLAKTLPPCLLALLLASCGSSRSYSSIEPGTDTAPARANLAIPPDLINSTSDNLVKNQETAQPVEVLPKPKKSAKITRNDEEGWLEVNEPAEQVWKELINYWASLGVDLTVNDPKSGIMETGWVRPAGSKDQGLTAGLFDKFLGKFANETTALEKYTMRLERKGDSKTRIYVTEKGVKKIKDEKGGFATFEHWTWVATKQDPDKVRLALSSIEYGLENAGQGQGSTASQQGTGFVGSARPPNVEPAPSTAPPPGGEHGLDYNPPLIR
jgi:outer membrane protein assembly factor BamC